MHFIFMAAQRSALGNSATRLCTLRHCDLPSELKLLPKSDYVRHFASNANHSTKGILQRNGILLCMEIFASKASKKETQKQSEKPVTFTEGASYSIIILAGLGVAAAAAYAVFKELIFEPKEYKIFNKALKRIQDDSQVRVRIGSPITGYGQESRNRAARQRIPNRIFTDEDGVEHVQINFYIRGPHGAGKVSAEMFKDKVDKQWKYTYLIVETMQPSRSQLILESYMPAPVAA
uniref:Mitochondrial import inner membrane translocase subunit Tim21 n=1 Tax=Salix viminalis TaxID=40686 RepID=A0A6N2MRY7_SALVM